LRLFSSGIDRSRVVEFGVSSARSDVRLM